MFGHDVNDPIYAHQLEENNSAYSNLQNELTHTRIYHPCS
jgi:hypothetical protein